MNNTHALNLRHIIYLFFIAAVTLAVFSMPKPGRTDAGERKIAVFEEGVGDAAKDSILDRHGALKIKRLGIINGALVVFSSKEDERAFLRERGVKRIDDDVIVEALGKDVEEKGKGGAGVSSTQPAQVLPWGISRIEANLVWPYGNTADPIRVGIIDTGISSSHPDLKANIKGGINTIYPSRGWNDDNGHGSHVAGIVAALNNSIGVVGVSPAADLYAIKVLGANGSGYLSDVIEGLDWAVANHMQVVNMSLGTASDIQSFHDAVIRTYNAGIVVVAAAGNSGSAVNFPGAYPKAIAVSATDSSNSLASFSSRGPEVDLAAPGVNIYSTYKGTGYATLSGTSMAAPHVTGVAALVLNTPTDTVTDPITGACTAQYDVNCNGRWDPAEVQKKMQDSALDLGSTGRDDLYGWGLVDAVNAVAPNVLP